MDSKMSEDATKEAAPAAAATCSNVLSRRFRQAWAWPRSKARRGSLIPCRQPLSIGRDAAPALVSGLCRVFRSNEGFDFAGLCRCVAFKAVGGKP
jgi:hypothetical protein